MGPLYTFNGGALTEALFRMAPDGALILIEEAVRSALAASPAAKALKGLKTYVLAPDLAARGLADAQLAPGIESVDYEGFVDLCAAHPLVVPLLTD